MSSEPALTYLMPAYAGASYAGLFGLLPTSISSDLTTTMLASATFGAAWAAFNIYRTKSLDLGVVTMGMVAVSTAIERGLIDVGGGTGRGSEGSRLTPTLKLVETIGCILVSINFALPIVAWNEVARTLGRKKTSFWLSTFWCYCLVMALFWAICAYRNNGRIATLAAAAAASK
mmetsp:Transcript_6172/g.13571  ORF Transcript_6172/g.13571 Transcript_6172/m.13571 type:complete len:174 (-) Transcript_6172:215-736(-)